MDKLVLENSLENPEPNTSPFELREVITVNDQSSIYSSNSSVFETVSLSNNGRFNNYYEAYFTVPEVYVVTGKNTGTDAVINWTDEFVRDSDLLLAIKNSNLNMINSCAIDYGNKQATQASDYLNMYLIYKQHESMTEQDEALNGSTIGYAKDSSQSWRYEPGRGISNNMNMTYGFVEPSHLLQIGNPGMRKRQEAFTRIDAEGMGREDVLGQIDYLKKTGQNVVVNYATHKVYFYNRIIRLRDLPVFSELGLMRGANFRITLSLNQCIFKVTKNAVGAFTFSQASFTGKNTNPLMVAESSINSVGNDPTNSGRTEIIPYTGGGWTIPNETELTISCSIGKVNYPEHSGLANITPAYQNIRLHVPSYVLKPDVQKRILSQGQKKVVYNEIITFIKTGITGVFDHLVTNGLSHMKRLIIVPVLNTADNENINPLLSPFSTEPATVSPYILENFQVQVASKNIYHNAVNYNYDMFLNELNGKYAVNSNMSNGVSGSRISLDDFRNNYGYIVVDLKRKSSDDETVPLSLNISGNMLSPKRYDFYMFIEVQRSLTYDTSTGQRLD